MDSGEVQEALTIAKKALATDGLFGERQSQVFFIGGGGILCCCYLSANGQLHNYAHAGSLDSVGHS